MRVPKNSPSPNGSRQRLVELRNGLLRLHKALLESERDYYERDIQRIRSSGQLLELVMHDPWFAWLHELSQLVVRIDETLEAEQPASPAQASRLVARARSLIAPDETGSGFARQYFEALQRDPGVVLAHADMVKLLRALG